LCTVTWTRHEGGYHLFSNRDEQLTRGVASSPLIREQNGVRFVAPLDGDRAGTWIGINEFGLSLCLLNGRARRGITGCRSRGLLLLDVMDSRSRAAFCARIQSAELSQYLPFSIVAIQGDAPAMVACWNGATLELDPDAENRAPLVSSSFDPDGVESARRLHFAELYTAGGALTAAQLRAFHASHQPARGPYSPCMHRDDAATVSFSHIRVDGASAVFEYRSGPPCRPGSVEVQRLSCRCY
jgi:Transport and Golgi organisation 2